MLGALLSACPRPIAKSFGPDSERIHREHMSRFYPFEQQAAGDQTGRAHAVHEELLSNFSALELYPPASSAEVLENCTAAGVHPLDLQGGKRRSKATRRDHDA